MKLCIPIEKDEGLGSKVYGHFGSAPLFWICDTQTGESETVDNQGKTHAHGKCDPLQALAGKDVQAVACIGMGARAVEKLNAGGIKVFQASGHSVEELLEVFRSGTLAELTAQGACQSHHGCH